MSTVSSTSSSSLGSFLNSTALTSVGSSSTPSGNSSLAVSGLASGFDWQSVVTQLANAERSAEIPWQNQQTAINAQVASYSTINDALTTLQADIKNLQDPTFYQSALAQVSDSTMASASAASGAALGTFAFNISQLATAAQINGAAGVGQILAPNGAGNTTIGSAGFGTPITAGTFTINGAQVNIASTDTLQQVFDNIASATGNTVTASYDSTSDTISLSSSNAIVLGSATDTSNFLQAAQLFNNNETSATDPVSNITTNSITSSLALGRVQLTGSLSTANLRTQIQDDGSGDGEFTVNGVLIKYNASSDSLQNVLDRITNSAAGVTASYDPLNNRFLLTDKTTGDIGISVQDVAGKGNFAATTGLSGGTLQRGQNLLYTVNNGPQLVSQSNVITSTSSGITGLTVTALKAGNVTVSNSSDTSTISTAIQQFVTDYNAVQTAISAQQIVSTDSTGKVTPGTLTGDLTASNIASQLRESVFSPVSGLSGVVNMLASLGIQTNGQDNTLKVTDPAALTDALTNNLADVRSFFSDPTSGWATQVNNYLNNTIGDNGTIPNHLASLTTQTNNITTQIANLEKKISSDSDHWTSEFQAMEQAQAQVNQEISFLNQQVSSTKA
ncbi:MAG TPA: flagellar filament capping protein FliD [Verrucomicrobiae bacterium]|jgi:flagellar hook-associated protein 2|nr:flagellar filament capping protein FliD [Verrucomicrobiae bacterium]